jgi:hypothetical protein
VTRKLSVFRQPCAVSVIINVLIPALLFESKIVLNSVVGWYKIKHYLVMI